MSSGVDIYNFFKPKLIAIGVPENLINLFVIGDTIKDYTQTPIATVIIETSTDTTHFTHFGSQKDTTTGNMENFTTIVEKAQDVYICIITPRSEIFTYRDNFYKSFEKNDQFNGTDNGAYRLVFLRDEFYNMDDKKIGLAAVVIYMGVFFRLQNKQIVKPISNINIEKNIEIETSY